MYEIRVQIIYIAVHNEVISKGLPIVLKYLKTWLCSIFLGRHSSTKKSGCFPKILNQAISTGNHIGYSKVISLFILISKGNSCMYLRTYLPTNFQTQRHSSSSETDKTNYAFCFYFNSTTKLP